MSSHRHGRGGGVGVYLHNSVQYCVMVKSCDRGDNQAFDFIAIELIEYKVGICCMIVHQRVNLLTFLIPLSN